MRTLLFLIALAPLPLFAKSWQEGLKADVVEKPSRIEEQVRKDGASSVKDLIAVINENTFSAEGKWFATLWLAKIMGKRSERYMEKLQGHKHWMVRLASLKALEALGSKQRLKSATSHALFDRSLVVREQALRMVTKHSFKDLSKRVRSMLFDKQNYREQKGKRARLPIIGKVIRTLGDLGAGKELSKLKTLRTNKAFKDIWPDLNYAFRNFQ